MTNRWIIEYYATMNRKWMRSHFSPRHPARMEKCIEIYKTLPGYNKEKYRYQLRNVTTDDILPTELLTGGGDSQSWN